MAHIRCDFRSEILDMMTSMTVILPDGRNMAKTKVVYLLHGLADNCTGWSRFTSVERYARKYDIALVIPEVQRSFYTDMESGIRYFTFVHDELREICIRFFGFSSLKENTYIMGLSMGGYGCLKCALTTPERYAGAAIFSAVTDIEKSISTAKDGSAKEYAAIFGDSLQEKDNILSLLGKTETTVLPKFYIACGNEDIRYFHSELIYNEITKRNGDMVFEHWEGDHNWDFWDEAVKRSFDFFFKGDN